jgi:hypothetical protein
MERIAKETPKPCFAVEFDLSSKICQDCEVQQQCFEALGVRRNKITLDKVVFSVVPPEYGLSTLDTADDPELSNIERTYMVCHQTIFGCRPRDSVGKHKRAVIAKFREAGCSIRLFMLTNMLAYKLQREIRAETEEGNSSTRYRAVLFTHASAIKRVNAYRDLCRKEFGTFDLKSLDTLTESDYAEADLEKRMLRSEIDAGKFIMGYKIRHSGPAWEALYLSEETMLDPYWLATEDTYEKTILNPYLAGNKGSKDEARLRYSVTQIVAQMKKKKDWGIAVFQARERIMQKAVVQVLNAYSFDPRDFETDQEVITNPLEFWVFVARAAQQFNCIKFLEGESSMFKR